MGTNPTAAAAPVGGQPTFVTFGKTTNTPAPTTSANNNGLKVDIYYNPPTTDLAELNTQTPYQYGYLTHIPNIEILGIKPPPDRVVIIMTGFFKPQTTGNHTFLIKARASAQLWVGTETPTYTNTLIQTSGGFDFVESQVISLNAGTYYPIVLVYRDGPNEPRELALQFRVPSGLISNDGLGFFFREAVKEVQGAPTPTTASAVSQSGLLITPTLQKIISQMGQPAAAGAAGTPIVNVYISDTGGITGAGATVTGNHNFNNGLWETIPEGTVRPNSNINAVSPAPGNLFMR